MSFVRQAAITQNRMLAVVFVLLLSPAINCQVTA